MPRTVSVFVFFFVSVTLLRYISHNKSVRKENFNLLHVNIYISGASQLAQWWRICLPMLEVQEAQVRSLVQEDPLGEEMATHSSIFFLGNPVDRGTWWGYSPQGCKELDTTEWLSTYTHMYPRTIWYNVYSFTNILSCHSCWKSRLQVQEFISDPNPNPNPKSKYLPTHESHCLDYLLQSKL